MTASAVAANISDEPVIEIDSRNSEILAEGFFFADPMHKLEYFKCQSSEDIEKLKEKYKINPNVQIITEKDTYKEKIMEAYPEPKYGTLNRLLETWRGS